MGSAGTLALRWLHPDGRVGGRVNGGPDDGEVRWVDGHVLGDELDPTTLAPFSTGPARVATCPASRSLGGRCGGCDLDRWLPDVRHHALAAMVARAYRLDDPPPVVPSPRDHGTRARIQLTIDEGRIGFRAPGTHDLVPVDDCELGRPELRAAIRALAPHRLPDTVDRVELRSDGERVVFAFRRRKGARGPVELPELGDVALDGRAVAGDPTLWLPHVGRSLRASPLSFYQVHLELNRALVEAVTGHVQAVEPERVLDLYAGIGNFSVPLAEAGIPVEAVELEGQATADLAHTASGLPVVVTTTPAERFDPQSTPFDVAVLDPPRAGAGEVMDRVLRSRPRRVVHVACDPVAGARDVARARKQGYAVASVQLFDLFPRTHHVETVTVLDRGSAPPPRPRRAPTKRRRRR